MAYHNSEEVFMDNIPRLIICLLDKDQANCPAPVSYSTDPGDFSRRLTATSCILFPHINSQILSSSPIKLALVCKGSNGAAKEDVLIKFLAFANLEGRRFGFHKTHKYSVFPALFLIIPITSRCQFQKCTSS
jgi:hypothetical protein